MHFPKPICLFRQLSSQWMDLSQNSAVSITQDQEWVPWDRYSEDWMIRRGDLWFLIKIFSTSPSRPSFAWERILPDSRKSNSGSFPESSIPWALDRETNRLSPDRRNHFWQLSIHWRSPREKSGLGTFQANCISEWRNRKRNGFGLTQPRKSVIFSIFDEETLILTWL